MFSYIEKRIKSYGDGNERKMLSFHLILCVLIYADGRKMKGKKWIIISVIFSVLFAVIMEVSANFNRKEAGYNEETDAEVQEEPPVQGMMPFADEHAKGREGIAVIRENGVAVCKCKKKAKYRWLKVGFIKDYKFVEGWVQEDGLREVKTRKTTFPNKVEIKYTKLNKKIHKK